MTGRPAYCRSAGSASLHTQSKAIAGSPLRSALRRPISSADAEKSRLVTEAAPPASEATPAPHVYAKTLRTSRPAAFAWSQRLAARKSRYSPGSRPCAGASMRYLWAEKAEAPILGSVY